MDWVDGGGVPAAVSRTAHPATQLPTAASNGGNHILVDAPASTHAPQEGAPSVRVTAGVTASGAGGATHYRLSTLVYALATAIAFGMSIAAVVYGMYGERCWTSE